VPYDWRPPSIWKWYQKVCLKMFRFFKRLNCFGIQSVGVELETIWLRKRSEGKYVWGMGGNC
jgi:hypothetical protein